MDGLLTKQARAKERLSADCLLKIKRECYERTLLCFLVPPPTDLPSWQGDFFEKNLEIFLESRRLFFGIDNRDEENELLPCSSRSEGEALE